MQTFKHSRKLNSKKVTGQGMSEYMIIVGLIAVAGIAAMGILGNIAKTNVDAAAVELGGGNGGALIDGNTASATAATTDAGVTTTLNNFESHNRIQ